MRRLPATVRGLGGMLVGSVPITIGHGPNAGCKWSLASAGRGYRSGTFETDRIDAILALLRPGDRFWDIGAHKGYVSLAAARAVGETGQVVALEPATTNQTFLRRHVAWNSIENIDVVRVAVSDCDGHASIGGEGSTLAFRIGRGDEVVPTRTINSLIGKDGFPAPDVIKIDAEGSEAAILRGGLDDLGPHMLIWISVHSRALFEECRELLRRRSFRVHPSAAMAELVAGSRLPWGCDRELLAIGRDRAITQGRLNELRLFREGGDQRSAPVS